MNTLERSSTAQASRRGDCWVIGLDVGGTKIAGGLVHPHSGQLTARRQLATRPERGGASVLETTRAMAAALAGVASGDDRKVCGIGVCVAELVDRDGNVTSEYRVRWAGVDVSGQLSRISAPVTVESDVRAAALAEARFGAGRQFEIFLYATVGTGVSVCLVDHGVPYAGARGGALVLSGNTLGPDPGQSMQGSPALLEAYVAGPALVTRYHREGGDHHMTRAEDVVAAAEAGDATADEVLRTAGTALGAGIADAVNLWDPEAVVIGGGLGLAGGVYWTSFVAATRTHIWSDAARDLPIVRAALGVDAGVIGAAVSCVRQHTCEVRRPGRN